MKPTIIADLDGTIALIDHRRHYVEGRSKDWKAFYAACVDDMPNGPVIDILLRYKERAKIVILSGRSDEVEAETRTWLDDMGIPYHTLMMRPQGDNTPDEALKERWYRELLKGLWVLFVLDDRDKVVRMWRSLGLTCLQVAPGAF